MLAFAGFGNGGVTRAPPFRDELLSIERLEERARISDIQNLYVYSLQGPQRVPLTLSLSLNPHRRSNGEFEEA